MAPREPVVAMPLEVRYYECDPQGIVFNAHYLAYIDMASFEVVDELFGSHAQLLGLGVDMVVAESRVRYHAPSRFQDQLVVRMTVDRVGTTSMVLGFDVRRGDELVVDGENRYVWVDRTTMRPVAPPDTVRAALLAAQGVE